MTPPSLAAVKYEIHEMNFIFDCLYPRPADNAAPPSRLQKGTAPCRQRKAPSHREGARVIRAGDATGAISGGAVPAGAQGSGPVRAGAVGPLHRSDRGWL